MVYNVATHVSDGQDFIRMMIVSQVINLPCFVSII